MLTSCCRALFCLTVCLAVLPLHTAAGQAPVLLYAPVSNLEHAELETLRSAKVSIDIAMYSFTDRELAEELGRLAQHGIRVRVYRDRGEYEHEGVRGLATTDTLLAAGVEVRIKGTKDQMHLKSYAVDGALLRTGSANWSPTGLKRQDNDVRYDSSPELARLFEQQFAALWDRPGNLLFAAQAP